MNKQLTNYYLYLAILLTLPLLLGFTAFKYYQTLSDDISNELAAHKGTVAGAKNQNTEMPKDIPLMSGDEIKNITTTNNSTLITIETNSNPLDITSFYDEYYYLNEWDKIKPSLYRKNGREIETEIYEGIVKITYK